MARAAGMKAFFMSVTSRDRDIFLPAYLDLSQLNDSIAIVVVNGQERYFDPGQRYCPYGHLAWEHTLVQGIREIDGGSTFGGTPLEAYTDSQTNRVANLTMDEHGTVTGSVKISWTGAAALSWRQSALRSDSTNLQADLLSAVEHLMPHGMEVSVHSVEKLEDYEQPLTALFDVKGQIASPTGKRLLIPVDLFEANTAAPFPHQKRETPVSFEYPHLDQDAVRINFPASLAVESLPAPETLPYAKTAAYAMTTESTPTTVTVRRTFLLGDVVFTAEQYPTLRNVYGKLHADDQEQIVLKAAIPTGN
jgi:hypothetical protein